MTYQLRDGTELHQQIIDLNKFNIMIKACLLVQERVKNTYFMIVGGLPRDLITGLKKPNDLDISIAGDYKRFFELLPEALSESGYPPKYIIEERKTKTGFVTIWTLKFLGNLYEFAPIRESEIYDGSGTLISTKLRDSVGLYDFSELVFDSTRRDFTINTLGILYKDGWKLYSPIIDDIDVYDDLINRRLRRCATYSLYNDPARIFRSIKFTLNGYQMLKSFTEREKKSLTSLLPSRGSGTILYLLRDMENALKTMRWLIKYDILGVMISDSDYNKEIKDFSQIIKGRPYEIVKTKEMIHRKYIIKDLKVKILRMCPKGHRKVLQNVLGCKEMSSEENILNILQDPTLKRYDVCNKTISDMLIENSDYIIEELNKKEYKGDYKGAPGRNVVDKGFQMEMDKGLESIQSYTIKDGDKGIHLFLLTLESMIKGDIYLQIRSLNRYCKRIYPVYYGRIHQFLRKKLQMK
jgi:hypothetical protein